MSMSSRRRRLGEPEIGQHNNFLLSVRALSLLPPSVPQTARKPFRRNDLGFFSGWVPFAEATAFAKRVRALRQNAFVICTKPPFSGQQIGLSRPATRHRDRQFETS